MLETLSPEQLSLIEPHRQEWLDKIFNGTLKFDEKKCREGIEWMYALAKLKKPIWINMQVKDSGYYAKRGISIRDVRNLGIVLGIPISTNFRFLTELYEIIIMKY